jgi:hypothetical protein
MEFRGQDGIERDRILEPLFPKLFYPLYTPKEQNHGVGRLSNIHSYAILSNINPYLCMGKINPSLLFYIELNQLNQIKDNY